MPLVSRSVVEKHSQPRMEKCRLRVLGSPVCSARLRAGCVVVIAGPVWFAVTGGVPRLCAVVAFAGVVVEVVEIAAQFDEVSLSTIDRRRRGEKAEACS